MSLELEEYSLEVEDEDILRLIPPTRANKGRLRNIRNTNKEILDYLKKKMEYMNSEKEKLDKLESTTKESD